MTKFPEAYFEDTIFEGGIGDVVICRYKGGGRVEAGVFLVSVWCLGVKDAFFEMFSEEEFQHMLTEFYPDGVPLPKPACAGRKLVEGAVNYAKALGISPHPDYKKGARVFGGINASDCQETFVYGRDGKPFFIQGPHDDKEKAGRILSILTNKLGPGGFEYIVLAGGDPFESESDTEDFFDLDEENEIEIVAMDSMAKGGEPDPFMVNFAESYCDQLRAEGYSVTIRYSGPANETLVKEIMETIREMAREMNDNSIRNISLSDSMLFIQNILQIRDLPPGERERFFAELPEEHREHARETINDYQAMADVPFYIHNSKVLDAENIGNERLLLLLELD